MRLFGNDPLAAARPAALEALPANVMLAEPQLNIAYANAAAMALMREAEAELRRELPGFALATLIGSNIDVFLKGPGHQPARPATPSARRRKRRACWCG